MKKLLIIFFLIIFSSSFSFAKDNKKITVEEIEEIFFGKNAKSKWGVGSSRVYLRKNDNETWQEYKTKIDRAHALKLVEWKRDRLKEKEIREKEEPKRLYMPWPSHFESFDLYMKTHDNNEREIKNSPRFQNRRIAKCLYRAMGDVAGIDTDDGKKCYAKVIRTTITRPEKHQKKYPGDMFYALDAMKTLS